MELKKSVTIHDIAKALNINSSTVSRALNDNPRVSAKTKKLVHDKAKEMHYQYNSLASNLRTQKSNTIGIIVPHITKHFFSTAISGIEEEAHKAGYNVIICQSKDSEQLEAKNINTLLSSRVDGILISPAIKTTTVQHIQKAMDRNVPIFFFDRYIDEINTTRVITNDRATSKELTLHLLSQNINKLAVLTGDTSVSIYENRVKGIYDAFQQSGWNTESRLILQQIKLDVDDAYTAINKWLDENVEFDAVFGMNDMAAIGSQKALQERGFRIPEDVIVAGFSNEPISKLVSPPITTVHQPAMEIGKLAAKKMINHIEEKDKSLLASETAVLESHLIIRTSSQRNK
ncbi:substrate-binding domain-containing protein [Flammeovirga yaeyamensis]|uniref:Substrate-binding domain-containing protein n=1 Tax=Flammeovirga yaeyamensis TaxID=367791 RepID=A0AAX1N2H2_9BACT|nr:LacI family DNA-binding transcriptional regulator [Flammeovirga yaeyamensis]MBB3700744.1 LacI family transcriptional regulator [Flammeovirga yaeyamensis]NMF37900.1 LacI family transcriptional regulator [Flammeovirga yaeyamensis]QWG01739.1 substrate-binding domain-containing protein [Flammeovirga yaeyamensis]